MSHIRQDYRFIFPIQTRWSDNDMYGHVNNVVYYSFFDTAANAFLIEHCGFHPQNAALIGLVVHSNCQYHAEISYPECIDVGVAISKIGNSSLQYQLAIFKKHDDTAVATGQFTHVFVDRHTRKSTPISSEMRRALALFQIKN
jgi:acyl-CoA thioester hydrolase